VHHHLQRRRNRSMFDNWESCPSQPDQRSHIMNDHLTTSSMMLTSFPFDEKYLWFRALTKRVFISKINPTKEVVQILSWFCLLEMAGNKLPQNFEFHMRLFFLLVAWRTNHRLKLHHNYPLTFNHIRLFHIVGLVARWLDHLRK